MANKLILASGSPRRKELLEKAGVSFEVYVPNVEEILKRGEKPRDMVARLSRDKAQAARDEIARQASGATTAVLWFLAADTTVVSPSGKNLGKPRDRDEASKMLKALSGKTHQVYTGYTIQFGDKRHTKVIETRVSIRKLTAGEVDAYVRTGESMDKAGAYAAQGFGMILIEKILGSYTNVVGLPIAEVLQDLRKLGYKGTR